MILCPAFINVYFSHYNFNMTSIGKVYKNAAEGYISYDWTCVVLFVDGMISWCSKLTIKSLIMLLVWCSIYNAQKLWFIVYTCIVMSQKYLRVNESFPHLSFYCSNVSSLSRTQTVHPFQSWTHKMMNCHDNGSKKFAYIKLIVCVRVIVSRFNGYKIDLDNISVNSGK